MDNLDDLLAEGYRMMKAGDFEGSLIFYEKAERIDPHQPGLMMNIAALLTILSRYEEALPRFQRLLSQNPDNPEMRRNVAMTLYHMKRWEESIRALDHLLELGRDSLVLNYRAEALFELGRLDEALWTFNQVLEMNPDSHRSLYCRAEIHLRHSRFVEALADCEAAIGINGEFGQVWMTRALALLGVGRFREAINSLGRAMEDPACEAQAQKMLAEIIRQKIERDGEFVY